MKQYKALKVCVKYFAMDVVTESLQTAATEVGVEWDPTWDPTNV